MEKPPKKRTGKAGITLVELAVTVGIITVISVVAFLGLSSYRGSQNLKLSMAELITVIRDVQKRSVTQEDGKQWGIKFTNHRNGDSYYEVFSGANYDSGVLDKSYSLRRGVKFGEPYSSSSYGVAFTTISGGLRHNKIISLIGNQKDAQVGDIILNALGSVFSRIETDLLGYWHFDEGKGNLVHDASPLASEGTIYEIGGLSCEDCDDNWRLGLGLDCKAGDCFFIENFNRNYVSGIFSEPTTLSAFTIEAWVQITGDQNKGGVLSVQNDFQVSSISGRFLGASRKPSFLTMADGEQNPDEFAAKTALKNIRTWYHLAYVYDGQYKKIYINGVENAGRQVPGKVFTVYFFEIGRSGENDNYILDGSLDEVKFYKRALSDSEILSHYNDFK